MEHSNEENNKIIFKGVLIIVGIIIFIIAWICSIIEENSKPNYLYSHYNYSSASSIPSTYKRKYNNYSSGTQKISSYYSRSKSYNYSSISNVSSDPYNAKDYTDAEDFYDDNYDDFYDYYNAEDYYNEHSWF